jgi:sec-independent protein translocase protein TatB
MLENLDVWKLGALMLLGLFLFGPERLPKLISDAVRVLRYIRQLARNASRELSQELGTDVRVEDLDPRSLIRRHLLSEEDETLLRQPFDDAYRDVRDASSSIARRVTGDSEPAPTVAPVAPNRGAGGEPVPHDPDAT